MKVTKILGKVCMGLGYTGLAAYGVTQLGVLYYSVHDAIQARRNKHWKKGYDKAWEDRQKEIDYLREENDRLYKEALKRTEAAE